MLIVKVGAVVRLPVSKTFTQNVPGFKVIVICGADAAVAFGVELVNVHAVAPLGVPIPRPTPPVGDGLRLASVTATVPVCATLNVKTFEPCAARVPENDSVGGVVDGDVVPSGSPQPAPAIAVRQPRITNQFLRSARMATI
jgi:hypothetical protein